MHAALPGSLYGMVDRHFDPHPNFRFFQLFGNLGIHLPPDAPMKTLYLVRHAKSSWKEADLSDHERPLNKRGELDAPRMGIRLRKRKPQPKAIISSSAVRAKTTAKLFATEIGFPKSDISIDERLYGAGPTDVVSIIHELNDTVDCAMLVGHNPTFTELVNSLGHCHIDNVPTCGMAILTFPVNTWKAIKNGKGELQDFDYPKKEEMRD